MIEWIFKAFKKTKIKFFYKKSENHPTLGKTSQICLIPIWSIFFMEDMDSTTDVKHIVYLSFPPILARLL
jgi:hypothetical protein